MCGHADETDDTHPATRTHPGTSVIPAALAICERDRLPGTQFLKAMVIGYEACARTMLTMRWRTPRIAMDAHLVDGLGHAWSGGAAGSPFTDPDGPDASTLMLDFLLQRRGAA